MAKHVLSSQDDLFDFTLFGLHCVNNQYALVTHLNHLLSIDLCLSDYLQLHLKNGRSFPFSLYQFSDEELGLEYHLIPNRSNLQEHAIQTNNSTYTLFNDMEVDESTYIIPELPQTDYFLLMKGDGLFQYETSILQLLKTSTLISAIQDIIPDELPSRRNLMV